MFFKIASNLLVPWLRTHKRSISRPRLACEHTKNTVRGIDRGQRSVPLLGKKAAVPGMKVTGTLGLEDAFPL